MLKIMWSALIPKLPVWPVYCLSVRSLI